MVKRTLKTVSIFSVLSIITVIAYCQTKTIGYKNKGTLTFNTSNYSNNKGKSIIYLYKKEDKIPGIPSMKASGEIVNNKSVIVFKDVPYGNYAAILFQDENSNGELDHSWGFPAEPMGFSNGWKLSIFTGSGMPTFEKLKFEFSEQKNVCEIHIN